ncbi:mannose-6-phosphate isomerase [Babesia caballi]|uniref:mannose-6-phosphate isomerase n=1 Tax=Babesia caballi TaxID=5871 RepID=A0AAV4LMG5_BABCB|nr:mannose-6-phosphate isomerase [Babesia caballi]
MEGVCHCIYLITPVVRNYDWGMPARSSLVYRLHAHGAPGACLGNLENTPFAELWIGDHDSAPCKVQQLRSHVTGEDGLQFRANDCNGVAVNEAAAAAAGESPGTGPEAAPVERLSAVYRRMGMQLFGREVIGPRILLKVLSIARPLSLQVHPDPECALRMYSQKHPSIVDSQAKPEMSVALTRFRAMCGLRPLGEIVSYAERYPPFARMIGGLLEEMRQAEGGNCGGTYYRLCERLLLEQEELAAVDALVDLVKQRPERDLSEEVFLTLNGTYGTEYAIVFAFVLNCIEVQRGDAFFIPPNTLHSYISGDCVELMNNSDNVIRGGLTSKATDSKAVLELIGREVEKGNAFPQAIDYVRSEEVSSYVVRYQPSHPLCNFAVWRFVVPPKTRVAQNFNNGDQPFLCLVVEVHGDVRVSCGTAVGAAKQNEGSMCIESFSVVTGDAFFMCPNLTLDVANNGDSDFVLYLGTET